MPTTDDDLEAIRRLAVDAKEHEAKKRQQLVVLIVGFLCWMFGAQLTTPARSEMLLLAFNNDTAAAA